MDNLSYLKKKILFPEKNITENVILKKLKQIFNDDSFFKIFLKEYSKTERKEIDPNSMLQKKTYKPQIKDLLRLYEFILLNKRTTVLEFGTGWSTLIISLALNNLKKKYSSEIKNLRRSDPFEVFPVDNEKKFLQISKDRINNFYKKKGEKKNTNFLFSDCNVSSYNGKFCIEYEKIPLCNPDFIYIDGPDIFNIKGKIKNFCFGHQDIMPIICDILKIEYFLIPGTIILMDGRTANAQFLSQNFQRKWIHYYDKKNDQNILYLDAPSLGKLNDRLLKFYSS